MGVYARILRTPGVAIVVFATLIGRMPIGISGLAILLFVRDVTGSFASAGLCAGALALGSAAGAPLQGRLIDRRGVHMLFPLAVFHAAGLLVVLGAGEAGAGTALLAAGSLLAGVATPPVSSVLRSRWPFLLAERPELIPGAFALDSVMIELIFVIGPLLTTAVVATVGAQYALIVSAACALGGVVLMLGGLRGRPGPEPTAEGERALGLGALAAPGLRTLVLASLPVGFTLGTIEVVLPAYSADEGAEELAGVLLAVWSGASGAAGLAWGAFGGRVPLLSAHLRLAWLLPLAIAPLHAGLVPRHHGAARDSRRPADRAADRLPQPARRASGGGGHLDGGLHLAADRARGGRGARRGNRGHGDRGRLVGHRRARGGRGRPGGRDRAGGAACNARLAGQRLRR